MAESVPSSGSSYPPTAALNALAQAVGALNISLKSIEERLSSMEHRLDGVENAVGAMGSSGGAVDGRGNGSTMDGNTVLVVLFISSMIFSMFQSLLLVQEPAKLQTSLSQLLSYLSPGHLFSFLHSTDPNPRALPTLQSKLRCLANLSLLPCLVCFLAFTRSVLYRFFLLGGTFHTLPWGRSGGSGAKTINIDAFGKQCQNFAWLNNASFRVTCDHRPLDIHALSALLWLVVFTVQVLLIRFQFRWFHRIVGKFGFGVAAVNVMGMIYLAGVDMVWPMEGTARPALFTPFMWATAAETFYCTKQAYKALYPSHSPNNGGNNPHKDFFTHALWIYRAFVSTFITPLIRFYPLVLRYALGTECVQLNKDRAVMGSMTCGNMCCFLLLYLAQIRVCDNVKEKVWDGYMRMEFYKLMVVLMADAYSFHTKGFFFVGMIKCASVGYEEYAKGSGWVSFSFPFEGQY